MNRQGKSPVILLVALILISLSLAGLTFVVLQKEKARSLALQAELDDVKTKQKVTEAKLQESQRLVLGLEAKIQEAQVQVDSLTEELRTERIAKQEALSVINQARADLEEQRDLRSELENKFTQAQRDMQKMQEELSQLQAKKEELEAKIKEIEQAKESKDVELGKIVVSPEAAGAAGTQGAAPLNLEGKVLVINKEYNFLVINLGSKDGVAVGDEFSVYKNNQLIGEVKAEKVHESMSALGFVTPDLKDKVSEGDMVVRKSK